MKKLKEFVKTKQNLVLIVLLILTIFIQVLLRINIGYDKAYLHIDEGYSYGLMNYKKVDIISNEDIYDQWNDNEYYQDYLSISKDEALDFSPVYNNQKNDVHPPFYYLLLRIASTITLDSFSKWTGIGLNILIFIISSIIIYLISNKVFKNKIYAVLIVLINGFTLASVETTIFIRMYALNALNLLIITYLHIMFINKEDLTLKQLIPMSIFIIIGSLTHYYYLVYLFVLYAIYMSKFIFRKNIKNAVKYTAMMVISALISLAIFPYSFVHIFMGYRGTGAISKLEKTEQIWNSLRSYLDILNNNVFNGTLTFIIIIALIVLAYKIIKNRKVVFEVKNKELIVILIPTIVYFTIISIVSPYQEIRYIMPICPLIIISIFYIIKVILEKVFSRKTTFNIISVIFIAMLIFPQILNLDVSYVYKDYRNIIDFVETTPDMRAIYVMNMNQNRFMDDLYLFSKIEKSYILDSNGFSEEKIEEIFKDIDISNGILVIINEGIDHKEYINNIENILGFTKCEHIQRLNAADVYKLNK